jgi:iron complex transport system ATP-binding protein
MTAANAVAPPQAPARAAMRQVSVLLAGKPVVTGLSRDFRAGEVTGVIGPNGSGKTTLLRALAGLINTSSGGLMIDGTPLAAMPVKARARRIAYLPQHPESHPFTAIETVLMARYPHLGRFEIESSTDNALARAALARAACEGLEDRPLQTLSGGERQRVMLARVLAQQADLVLLDEPTAPMDIRYQLLAMELAREEAMRGAAVVAAMHDLSLASRYCDVLVLLHRGEILAAGTPLEVVTTDNMRAAYGVEARVGTDPSTGLVTVFPIAASPAE